MSSVFDMGESQVAMKRKCDQEDAAGKWASDGLLYDDVLRRDATERKAGAATFFSVIEDATGSH
jgi:hypothetical protein